MACRCARFSDAIVKAMGEAWQATSAEMAAQDPMTKRVVESFQAFLAKAQPYARDVRRAHAGDAQDRPRP